MLKSHVHTHSFCDPNFCLGTWDGDVMMRARGTSVGDAINLFTRSIHYIAPPYPIQSRSRKSSESSRHESRRRQLDETGNLGHRSKRRGATRIPGPRRPWAEARPSPPRSQFVFPPWASPAGKNENSKCSRQQRYPFQT